MNQQEWIEYFELVNGRKPTPAELAQAQAAGEFILERPNPNVFGSNGQATEQRPIKPAEPVITMTQQPQFAQATATFQQVVPAKKVCLRKLRLFWHQSLVLWQRFYLSLEATHYGATNQVRLRMEHMR